MKVRKLISWAADLLETARIENPRFEVDILLAAELNLSRAELYLDFERVLAEPAIENYQKKILRRERREPLQYILQHQEFMGLDFYVDERVLIPRADSEILVEKLLDYTREGNFSPKVLDLGTGSGALAISVAHFRPQARVVGSDLSVHALEVAVLNALRLGVRVEWRKGDFLYPALGENWDWIITNPPYLSSRTYQECQPEIHFEPRMALWGGEDGLDFYRRLAQEAPPLLKTNGKLLMEIGWDQGREVSGLFEDQGFETMIFPDLAGRNRVVLAE